MVVRFHRCNRRRRGVLDHNDPNHVTGQHETHKAQQVPNAVIDELVSVSGLGVFEAVQIGAAAEVFRCVLEGTHHDGAAAALCVDRSTAKFLVERLNHYDGMNMK